MMPPRPGFAVTLAVPGSLVRIGPVLAALTLLSLTGGCALGGSGGQGGGYGGAQTASAARQADCRQRADEVYAKQNRAEIYKSDTYASTGRDSPFATSGLSGVPTRGLSSLYARDTLESDCLSGAAGNVGSATGAATPTP